MEGGYFGQSWSGLNRLVSQRLASDAVCFSTASEAVRSIPSSGRDEHTAFDINDISEHKRRVSHAITTSIINGSVNTVAAAFALEAILLSLLLFIGSLWRVRYYSM